MIEKNIDSVFLNLGGGTLYVVSNTNIFSTTELYCQQHKFLVQQHKYLVFSLSVCIGFQCCTKQKDGILLGTYLSQIKIIKLSTTTKNRPLDCHRVAKMCRPDGAILFQLVLIFGQKTIPLWERCKIKKLKKN